MSVHMVLIIIQTEETARVTSEFQARHSEERQKLDDQIMRDTANLVEGRSKKVIFKGDLPQRFGGDVSIHFSSPSAPPRFVWHVWSRDSKVVQNARY